MNDKKKSFLLYLDTLEILHKLTDEQAGKLLKAFLAYHSEQDLNLDPMLDLVFFSFQAQFERDLVKYQNIVERNKNNGSKGGRPKNPVLPNKPSGLSGNPSKPKKADSVNGSDSGNDSDSDKEVIKDIVAKAPKFNFKKELLALNVDKKVLDDWMEVRKKKKATNSETAFTGIMTEINKSGLSVADAIKVSAENSWSGFKSAWYANLSPTQQAKSTHTFTEQNYTSGKF